MKFIGALEVFPTKLWGFEYDHSEIIEQAVADLYTMKANGLGKGHEDNFHYSAGSFQSFNLKEYQEFDKILSDICKMVGPALENYPDDRPKNKFRLTEAWGNINPPQTTISEHLHPGADYSGVLYLKATPHCGNLAFRDPRIHYETIYQTPYFETAPAIGRMIIFPGWLRHNIGINLSNEDRIGIAFNINI